mgnify:CR=1 FL=1
MIKELNKLNLFYSIIIFGSYSNGKSKENSDLDIAIIIQDKKYEKEIKIGINSSKNKSILELDVHIITEEEFLDMLKGDYENLCKEIVRNHQVIYNSNIFYNILEKEVKNGFKIVY